MQRIKRHDNRFEDLQVFEDTLGELRNLAGEYNRTPRSFTKVQELGFSKWIPFSSFKQLITGLLPGVYVIAASHSQPVRISIVDQRVVYIGETVNQDLCGRLYQFSRSIMGKEGHSGGRTLKTLGYGKKKLWLSIRSFPLAHGMAREAAEVLRPFPDQTESL